MISDVFLLYIKRKGSRGEFGHVAIGGGEGPVGCLGLSSGDEHSFCSEGHLPDVLVQMWLQNSPGDSEGLGAGWHSCHLSEIV